MSLPILEAVWRRLPAAGLALTATLWLAGSAAAQNLRSSDLLDQYRNRNAVAAQKLENDVRDAVAEAQRLAATDAGKAVERLKKALAQVEDDTALTSSRRDSLLRDLKERIRVLDTDSRRAAQGEAERTERQAQVAARQAEQERQAAEQDKVRQLLSNVRALQAAGKQEEAGKLAEELARRYPDNLAVQVATRTSSMTDRVNEARRLQGESERRRLLVYQDTERSAMLPIGDIEFPADWAQKTKMRKAHLNPMTAQERAILDALSKPITLDMKDAKLDEVLDVLEHQLGQTLDVDQAALDQAMIKYDTPVTVRARRPTSARTVLRQLLSQLGLAYVVKDQMIHITTEEKARTMMTVRTYYIGDLLSSGDVRLPPALNQLQMAQNIAYITELIQRSVDPDSWAVNEHGGLGSIAFDPLTMSLVVKQSAEVHYVLGGGLGGR